MPTNARPPYPKKLLFTSKRLDAKAVPTSFQFSARAGETNPQIAFFMQIEPGQTIELIAVPDVKPDHETLGWLAGIRPGSRVKIPEGVKLTVPFWKALTENTVNPSKAGNVIDSLKNAGWHVPADTSKIGSRLFLLGEGLLADATPPFDGFGSVVCSISVELKEVGQNGDWITSKDKEGKEFFDPKLQVGWINASAPALLKSKATKDTAAEIDALFAKFLGGGGSAAPAQSKPSDSGPPESGPPIDDDVPF
jgi:hypothetical protein